MNLPLLPQLEPVLDGPQPPVRNPETGAVVLGYVAAGNQGAESVEGCRGPDRRVSPAMNELKQLDRELDIADPAGSQLHVVGTASSARATGGVSLDLLLHRSDG